MATSPQRGSFGNPKEGSHAARRPPGGPPWWQRYGSPSPMCTLTYPAQHGNGRQLDPNVWRKQHHPQCCSLQVAASHFWQGRPELHAPAYVSSIGGTLGKNLCVLAVRQAVPACCGVRVAGAVLWLLRQFQTHGPPQVLQQDVLLACGPRCCCRRRSRRVRHGKGRFSMHASQVALSIANTSASGCI